MTINPCSLLETCTGFKAICQLDANSNKPNGKRRKKTLLLVKLQPKTNLYIQYVCVNTIVIEYIDDFTIVLRVNYKRAWFDNQRLSSCILQCLVKAWFNTDARLHNILMQAVLVLLFLEQSNIFLYQQV